MKDVISSLFPPAFLLLEVQIYALIIALTDLLKRRHHPLNIVTHGLQHSDWRPEGVGRPFTHIAEPWMRHLVCQVVVGDRLHGVELLVVWLALYVVGVDDVGAFDGDQEGFVPDCARVGCGGRVERHWSGG